jgi:hypothetical protein
VVGVSRDSRVETATGEGESVFANRKEKVFRRVFFSRRVATFVFVDARFFARRGARI